MITIRRRGKYVVSKEVEAAVLSPYFVYSACRFRDTTPSPILHSSSSLSKLDKAGGNFGSVRDMILVSNPLELSSRADICLDGEDRLESSDYQDCDLVRAGKEVPGDAI